MVAKPPCRRCFRAPTLVCAGALVGTVFVFGSAIAAAQEPSAPTTISGALTALETDSWVTRSYTFAEIGRASPEVFASLNSARLIYLPVPLSVELKDAEITLNGDYFRAEDRKTTFTVSIDGYPVAARAPLNQHGSLDLEIAVDSAPRDSGFVELGLRWSVLADEYCLDGRDVSEVLRIEPTSRFSFTYNTAAIKDIATAWSALPATPVILVSGRTPSEESYDAAWRVGAALARQGRDAVYKALPAIGQTIDTSGLEIAPTLTEVPAFAALAGKDRYTLANASEVGALLLLPSSPYRADIAIDSEALRTEMTEALDALATQMANAGAEATYEALRQNGASLASQRQTQTISLETLGSRPVIAVLPQDAGKAAALFDSLWRKLSTTRALTVNSIDPMQDEGKTIPLVQFGGSPKSFGVLGRSDWAVTFDLQSVAANGSLPAEAIIDVSASPGASPSYAVATLLLNDYLLGATQLKQDGSPTRISAEIPPYALAGKNLLVVRVQRQVSSNHCNETPQAFPAAIQPTSHIRLGTPGKLDGFVGVMAKLALNAELIVPEDYLSDPAKTLPLVVQGVNATGLSLQRTRFKAVDAPTTPTSSFLAFGDTVADTSPHVLVRDGRLIVKEDGTVSIDVQKLNEFIAAEVVDAKGTEGIQIQRWGTYQLSQGKDIRLGHEDVAVFASDGSLLTLPTTPLLSAPAWTGNIVDDTKKIAKGALDRPVVLVIIVLAVFLLLLLRAVFVRRRATRSDA